MRHQLLGKACIFQLVFGRRSLDQVLEGRHDLLVLRDINQF